MPVISLFYGIIVRMYNERGGQHKTPHIHAEYAGDQRARYRDIRQLGKLCSDF